MRSQNGACRRTLVMPRLERSGARCRTLWYFPFCVFLVADSSAGRCRDFGIFSTFSVLGSELARNPLFVEIPERFRVGKEPGFNRLNHQLALLVLGAGRPLPLVIRSVRDVVPAPAGLRK